MTPPPRERRIDAPTDHSDCDDIDVGYAIRPMSGGERLDRYNYCHRAAEMLADALLGIEFDDDDCEICSRRCGPRGGEASLLPAVLKMTMIASSGAAIAGVLLWTALQSDVACRMVMSVSSSITPYLLPSSESFASMNVAIRGYAIQVQAIVHSMPYLVRHANRIRLPPLLPFLLKLLRKCIILEAWRHIWITVYKLTRYVRKSMTLHNARVAYHRLLPPWIRRGVRSMFQSVVQAHVAGAVSDLIGSASFEGAIWTSYGVGDDGVGDGESFIAAAMDSTGEDGAISIQEALSEFADSAMAGVAVETMADAGAIEAMLVEVGDTS